jgi:hypothetical protein
MTKVTVFISTDGEENSSANYTLDSIKAMIKEQTDKYNWDFVFAGANIDAFSTAGSVNIAAANTKAQAAFDKANTAPKTTTSATAPVSPTVGDMWYDTDNDVLLRYTNDGTSNNWIDITGQIFRSTFIRQTYLITANVS